MSTSHSVALRLQHESAVAALRHVNPVHVLDLVQKACSIGQLYVDIKLPLAAHSSSHKKQRASAIRRKQKNLRERVQYKLSVSRD